MPSSHQRTTGPGRHVSALRQALRLPRRTTRQILTGFAATSLVAVAATTLAGITADAPGASTGRVEAGRYQGAMSSPRFTSGHHHRRGPASTPSATSAASTPTAATAQPSPHDTMTSRPSMPAVTMGEPKPGRWISVDAAQQAADTAAFFARTPQPVTGNPVPAAKFHATCTVSHHASDDPIVFPGQPGASQDHTFIGNTTTNASSTLASLRAGSTTCTPPEDRSAYWIPTLYQKGKAVDPDDVTIYYGSRLADPSRTQPFPAGFRMITGDPAVQTGAPGHQGNHFECAGAGGEVGRTANGVMPICASTAHLVRQVTFADCWDGVHLDSPDHRSHVSDAVRGACPAAFPVAIPNISFVISYPLSANTEGITLSSGTTYSMHADFINAWDDDALAARVRNCLDQKVECDAQGTF